ncbi:hypothetical protein KBC55_00970 [Patescibacteria group bacterium]|nr:hypothetical protein [Patescibacteria group bacterium]
MPAKPAVKKATTIRKTASARPPMHSHGGGACTSCNALPTGSMELLGLMLVLVFSLTAVLLTSVYALNLEAAKVAQLETALAHAE